MPLSTVTDGIILLQTMQYFYSRLFSFYFHFSANKYLHTSVVSCVGFESCCVTPSSYVVSDRAEPNVIKFGDSTANIKLNRFCRT